MLFKTVLLHSVLLIIAVTCFGLGSWPSSGSLSFLLCAAYVSAYLAEVVHI